MFSFEKFTLFLLFYKHFLLATAENEFQSIKIIFVRCNMSEKYIFPNYSCFAKPYSRNFTTANIIATTKMPMSNIYVEAKLLFRYGLIYREVITSPKIDFCNVVRQDLKDLNLLNRVISFFISYIKATYPREVHECPYKNINLRNSTGNATGALFSVFPTGEYRFVINCYNRKDEVLAQITIGASFNSSFKGTFG